jgi:MoxR-like ATPase
LVEIADRTTGVEVPRPQPVADGETIRAMQHLARGVPIASHLTELAARLVRATLPGDPSAPDAVRRYVSYGSSPRGMQALILAGKIIGLLDGRYNVAAEDLAAAALPALRHRLILNFEAQAEGIAPDDIVRDVTHAVLETAAVNA